MLTDSFDVPRFGLAPSWAEILGRAATASNPVRVPGVAGRRVLVTGAGGFIGSEMARVFAASGAAEIVLLEMAEQALFDVHRDLTERGSGGCTVPVLGSVCDAALLAAVFEEHRPQIVLHAAALKHVPLMERNPFAAVETNALGTWKLARMAAERGARRMILVSTDKAVAPASIMGASKRIAELAMLSAGTGCGAVRLVNVIGSTGSVGPLFAEQIAQGGPVTVTDPKARRYFMTLDEVAELLAEAVAQEGAGGVLVPDTGAPMLIAELARRMIAASGRDVAMEWIGLRPGEKLNEAVVGPREHCAGDATRGLRQIAGPVADVAERIASLEAAVARRDLPSLLRVVEELVPDYAPSVLLRDAACAVR